MTFPYHYQFDDHDTKQMYLAMKPCMVNIWVLIASSCSVTSQIFVFDMWHMSHTFSWQWVSFLWKKIDENYGSQPESWTCASWILNTNNSIWICCSCYDSYMRGGMLWEKKRKDDTWRGAAKSDTLRCCVQNIVASLLAREILWLMISIWLQTMPVCIFLATILSTQSREKYENNCQYFTLSLDKIAESWSDSHDACKSNTIP